MDAVEALVLGLPGEADRIRRLFWRDPEFRTVCEDYRDAVEALGAIRGQRIRPRPSEYRAAGSRAAGRRGGEAEGERA